MLRENIRPKSECDRMFVALKKFLPVIVLLLTVTCGKDADHYIKKGNEMLKGGEIAEAVVQFEKAVEAEPENHEAQNALGVALSAQGSNARAIEHFRTAVALNDRFIEAHYNLGRALMQTGQYVQSVIEFKKVIHLDSTYSLAYLSAGAALLTQGLIEDAIDAYSRAIRCDSSLVQAYMGLAGVYLSLQRYEDGINILLIARERAPRNAPVAAMAGRTAILNRNFDQAIELLTEAARLDSQDLVSRNDLATALMLSGRKDEAIDQWERILTMNPESAFEQVVSENLKKARAD